MRKTSKCIAWGKGRCYFVEFLFQTCMCLYMHILGHNPNAPPPFLILFAAMDLRCCESSFSISLVGRWGLLFPWEAGFSRVLGLSGCGGLSLCTACGIFPDQGLNPSILHWQVDFLPLSHQGSPLLFSSWIITHKILTFFSVHFSSVAQSCPTLCNPMNRLPVHHQLSEFTQTHVHWVGDAIQPSHPLSFPSPPTFNLSQHQGFFKWVSSSYQVAKVLEFQLQHQSFQWTPRTDLL